MRSISINPRLLLRLVCCGLLLAAYLCLPNPAAAQLRMGFGRMGGFAGPRMGGTLRHAPGWGGGRFANQPCGGNRRHRALSQCSGHRRIGRVESEPGTRLPEQPPRSSSDGRSGRGQSGVPPRGERRFVTDEVITGFRPGASAQAIDRIARRYDLTQLETQSFPLIGTTLYRWRIGGRRSLADVVGALEDERIVASAQPNYVFTLQEERAATSADPHGDAGQYVLRKLQIADAHRLATGKDVTVAVIDSQIDAQHPDLDGTIAKSFDALGGEATPHRHGTAMAGAIAAHGKLLGIAPDVRLLAARAFDNSPGEAKGTSFAIDKGLQWAADNRARIVNMSFAGPADPLLHRMLTAAYGKDMVLIAAAGNAGPNVAAPYPAADPDVIAVTASDANDGLFKMADRGPYVAVAAPGVEILALAPADSYQITTGTSVAAAHVSGIAALLLERRPSLKPKNVRTIIMATAKPLGAAGRRADFGAGLVNAYRATMSLDGEAAGKADAAPAKP